MGPSLLTPFFLLGLVALAVPIYVHLSDRDRRNVVRFPSLKFLTRLPYRQVRRQRIRHRFLFALRGLALMLLVLAFSRPFWPAAAGVQDGDASRAVVIAVDRSYSMSHGETWRRVMDAVKDTLELQPPGARVALITFDEKARIEVPSTTDHQQVRRVLDGLSPGSGKTRLASALELASEILLDAASAPREVVMISDFQARAWDPSMDVGLLPGARLQAVDVAAEGSANVTLAGVEVKRSEADGLRLVARLLNQSQAAQNGVPVTVTVDSAVAVQTVVDLPAAGSGAALLGPIDEAALASGRSRISVHIGQDSLEADNSFHLVLSPRPPVPVLLVAAADARDEASRYLREALRVAEDPAFEAVRRTVDQVRPADVRAAKVVIVLDSPFPSGEAGDGLARRVAQGGGLWVILGSRTPRPPEGKLSALLPASWRETVDRLDSRGVSLASVDYDHPVFEVFSGPDGGNLMGPRFFRYRPLVLHDQQPDTQQSEPDTQQPESQKTGIQQTVALARYTDGAVAMAELSVGDGRVLLWGSPLDNRWSNLPVQAVFPPFVHQVCRHLSGERPRVLWRQVGDALDLGEVLADQGPAPNGSARRFLRSPSGLERELDGESAVRLDEAGFYQVRPAASEGSSTVSEALPIAVNVDHLESDLESLDVQAFVAASTSLADPGAGGIQDPGANSRNRQQPHQQRTWWYLLLLACLLLAAESLWSNRLPSGPAIQPEDPGVRS